ncbi:hypothetical protein CHLRE_13g562750v5 [Chlamydomonas reinhardtii]|uniref:Uncharacterized protein n=1 Tax=Chlamydomonas reinhardtii TaxID=3055 RepID=A0A2K3CZ18_CHLRE|nr:uncharacterized protein CHLRE_13g562750v5 [Chlamydomonas reinhardtii]PNW73530.1 hypothetical protein CHLRE_13g562750v5 [Chlamydomonas reinhardtii]
MRMMQQRSSGGVRASRRSVLVAARAGRQQPASQPPAKGSTVRKPPAQPAQPAKAATTARRGREAATTSSGGSAKLTAAERRQQAAAQQQSQSGTRAASTTAARRQAARQAAKAAEEGGASSRRPTGQDYFNFTGFPFPLGPFFTRNTVRREIERDTMWVFEQTQALDFFSVYTPVRMTVIKLASGGLWVHAPVAPTAECVRLLKELDAPVEYIVLPTFAYEHKIFVGPFSRRFPKAKVYVAPYQWSFPLNLPPQFFGIFPTGELVSDDPAAPWAEEIGQKVFLPPSIGVNETVRFTEVAFFHKKTRTLLVTDAVVYVPEDPPEVIPVPALLDLARDNYLAQFVAGGRSRAEVAAIARPEPVEDSREARRKGWARMALLVLYFGPGDLLTPEASFAAISGRLFVGPVVETLVYSKIPKSVVEWVEDICGDWDFRQVVPCHFEAPVKAGPAEFRRAFAFAYEQAEREGLLAPRPEPEPPKPLPLPLPGFLSGLLGKLVAAPAPAGPGGVGPRPVVFPETDMKTLNSLNNSLLFVGAVKRNADLDAAKKAAEAEAAAEAAAAEADGEAAKARSMAEAAEMEATPAARQPVGAAERR